MTVSEPTFTVVMPAYNAASTIAGSIRSVLAQSRSDWELLVVDDGSTDETVAVVQSFQDDRVLLLRGEHAGPAAARNRALGVARGKLVSLLDSDDLFLPTYLASMNAALEAAPEASLAYTQAWILDDRSGRIDRRPTAEAFQPGPEMPPSDPALLFRQLLADNFVFVATTSQRSALEDVGFLNTACIGCEDYELWLRLAAHGHHFVRVVAPLAIYRRHARSLSADPATQARRIRDMYVSVSETFDLSDDLRTTVARRVTAADEHIALVSGAAGSASLRYRVRAFAAQAARNRFGRNLLRAPPTAEVAKTLALSFAANAAEKPGR
jgi:GT2 family glycosyltransferase